MIGHEIVARNFATVTAHRRNPNSSAALTGPIKGGQRWCLCTATAFIISQENWSVNHVLSEHKGAAIAQASRIMKTLPYMQAAVNDRQDNLAFGPFYQHHLSCWKARVCSIQKHESQWVIIACGGLITMYHWDKNAMNGQRRLEKRCHCYVFTYQRMRIAANIQSMSESLTV